MSKTEELNEDNIPCPSCKSTNIYIDSDGNATCLDCDYSWELKDYTEYATCTVCGLPKYCRQVNRYFICYSCEHGNFAGLRKVNRELVNN